MVDFKAILLVLAAVGLAQEHAVVKRGSAWYNPLAVLGTPADAMQAAIATITSTSAAVKSQIDSAAATLNGYIDSARALREDTKGSAQAQIDAIVANALVEWENRTDAMACFEQKTVELKALGLQTVLDQVHCAGRKIVQLEDMLQSVVNASSTALSMTPGAIAEVHRCRTEGGNTTEIMCYPRVAATFVYNVNYVLVKMAAVMTEASVMFGTMHMTIGLCAARQVAVMTFRVGFLVGKLAYCSVSNVVG